MRLLFLGYESESCSMAYLAELMRKDGHEPLLALCDSYNFIDDDGIHDFFNERDFTDWVNYSDQYRRLYREDWTVDWDYLRRFEVNNTDSKNIQQLLMSDPILFRENHFREPYYTTIKSREQQYYWAELLIRWIMDLLTEFDPDAILTYGRNYFVKNVVAQVAASSELEMLTLIPSRIQKYCHISREFSLGTDAHIVRQLKSDDDWEDTSQAESHIDSFSDSTGGLYDAKAQRRSGGESLYTVSEIINDIISQYITQAKFVLRRTKNKYRGRGFANNYFNSHRLLTARFRTQTAYRRLKYELFSPFEGGLPERPFIYVPLHTLPESSTLTLSTEYYERDLVRFMSKELPSGIDIAVKENPNMVGIRSFDYYDDLRRLPNVRLVDPIVESKELIKKSKGVCGISGTALLEAAMLDTPTHHFGCPEFAYVLDYEGHKEFSDFAAACRRGEGNRHPKRVRRYLQYVFNSGRELNYNAMRTSVGSDAWKRATETAHEMFTAELGSIDE